ncbi:Lrp/AsnC family transcriptional regulator [Gimibacter soli]|uniref:Lrp/AsnC family transcriptional regulator n=1 Tax=Gimibacter soli TaxID=3024400 RepID=A0AAE9XQJ4_9PROT|nr:Lrp/AsnC family transcriptional regulator [Gimibacter soli]WCL53271.1 Lrp/AsnC family transcriptional regulator [Gimibacter soli]
MKPANLPKLDKRDYLILKELQDDSTITYRTMSERVALSPSACVSRVQLMEKSGVILGYHASIAIEKVRPTLVMLAEISLASHNPDDIRAFDNLLKSMPEIVEVLRVNGPFDYVVRFCLSGVHEWQEFAHRLLEPKYKVEKMVTHVVMEETKRFAGYPVPSE